MRIEQELEKMGFALPTPKPLAAYVPAVPTSDLIYSAGQGPSIDGKAIFTGKLGRGADRRAGVQGGAGLRGQLSGLREDHHRRPGQDRAGSEGSGLCGFGGWLHPAAVGHGTGPRELLVTLFGDKGQHARSAIGTNQLPLDIPVEVEIIVQVRD